MSFCGLPVGWSQRIRHAVPASPPEQRRCRHLASGPHNSSKFEYISNNCKSTALARRNCRRLDDDFDLFLLQDTRHRGTAVLGQFPGQT